EIAMIFQEPMTALNPLYTVGNQIVETLELHEGLDKRAARARAIALLERTGGFDARLRGAEDTDQWVRLAAAGRYACLPDLQVVVTRNPGSVSRNREAMRRGALDCLDKNRALLPVAQQSAFWRSCRASVLA
ncbi:hypothetical protein NK983_24730, partial [Salmonella enterica subsp. enterica serovar Typhimurium]|nr:hypothetical protein [Salmonella enterica subsp. enterica serovar Typhimurium]